MGLKILDFSLFWARPASYGDFVKSCALNFFVPKNTLKKANWSNSVTIE